MDFHLKQRQHRVPKIYLKQFGFQENTIWKVFVVDSKNHSLECIPIDLFSVTINEFDFSADNYKQKRHFEDTAGNIESLYPMVVNTISNQKRLRPKHEDILRHFAASLILRSECNRKFFIDLLQDPETRDKFLDEVMMFDDEKPDIVKLAYSIMDEKEHLPLIQGKIANHLVHVLRSFQAVVLQDFDGRGWPAFDDPVCIDFQKNYSWILPIEAELYLPLSRKYCLFLFHPKSALNINPLRNLQPNKLHCLVEEDYDRVFKKLIRCSTGRYLIVDDRYRSDFETVWGNLGRKSKLELYS
jgi:hypothetical protein